MSQSDDILVARNLHKSFGKGPSRVHVLRGLDLSVRRGEFLAVMGPSGCGKSTLLHVAGLLTRAEEGQVLLDGRPVGVGGDLPNDEALRTELRRGKIGFVFQRFNLIEVLTARQNVELSLRIRGLADEGQIDELLGALGVAHVAGRKPGQMSIGEQQRVAVARALAHRPAIVLADEPTGNLDSASAADLLEILRRMNRRQGQTIVMITHSSEAAGAADRTVHMKDGRLLDQGK
jgi:putative ABC transport system ATP-binding protein